MKKVISILISFVLLISLSACGYKETTSTNGTESTNISDKAIASNASESAEAKSSEKFDEKAYKGFLANYVDLSHYELKTDEYGIGIELKYEFTREYKSNDSVRLLNDLTVTVENSLKFKIGDPVSRLLNNGWKFKYDDPEDTMGANLESSSRIFTNGNKEFRVNVANLTEKELKYKQTEISGVTFENYEYPRSSTSAKNKLCPEFSIGGINNNSELKDIIKVFGEPEHLKVYLNRADAQYLWLYYSDFGYASYQIEMTVDGKEILEFRIL